LINNIMWRTDGYGQSSPVLLLGSFSEHVTVACSQNRSEYDARVAELASQFSISKYTSSDK